MYRTLDTKNSLHSCLVNSPSFFFSKIDVSDNILAHFIPHLNT